VDSNLIHIKYPNQNYGLGHFSVVVVYIISLMLVICSTKCFGYVKRWVVFNGWYFVVLPAFVILLMSDKMVILFIVIITLIIINSLTLIFDVVQLYGNNE